MSDLILDPLRDRHKFILENTIISSPPHVPEISLHLADEAFDLWHKTETELDEIGLQPPFWAFPWAGGQGLARYILDNPHLVEGKSVLDFASGSGLVGIAAKMAGAKRVIANDIDAFCQSAVEINALQNSVKLEFSSANLLNIKPDWISSIDVILVGDVFYDQAMVNAFLPVFKGFVRAGKSVLVGDPGRSYLPKSGLTKLAAYSVAVTRQLEDSEIKHTIVWQLQSG